MATSSSSVKKSKQRFTIIYSKLAILDCLKGGATQADLELADEYAIRTPIIGDIMKEEANIKWFTSMMDGMAMNKKGHKVMHLHIMYDQKRTVHAYTCTSKAHNKTGRRKSA